MTKIVRYTFRTTCEGKETHISLMEYLEEDKYLDAFYKAMKNQHGDSLISFKVYDFMEAWI